MPTAPRRPLYQTWILSLAASLLLLAPAALHAQSEHENPAETETTADDGTHAEEQHDAHPDDTHSAHAGEEHADEHGDAHAAHGHEEEGGLDVSDLLFHHLLDTHTWHLFDIPSTDSNGHTHYVPVALNPPYIVYSSNNGLDFFFLHGHDHHELEAQAHARGYSIDHYGKVGPLQAGQTVIDFSPSKLPIQLFIVGLLVLWMFGAAAKIAKRRHGQAPKGVQSLIEPIVLFIRDEVARANLYDHHDKENPYKVADRYTPYLLTVFFFIWFSNLLGLTPFNSNIAGNISFTVALTVLTFLLVQFNGSKDYWQHIFWYPGVGFGIKLLMLPVEIVGVFTKPLALAIRLFANITGGHIAVLALVSMIFILKESMGTGAAWGIAPVSVLLTTVIFLLEMIVAIVQAYIFTLLTAVFIGMAREKHDHEHDHGAAHGEGEHTLHNPIHIGGKETLEASA